MGKISGTNNVDTHHVYAASDVSITGEPGSVETDVNDVFADGEKMGHPVFNVTKDEFYQNMTFGRKRLRLKSGTPGQQYMQKTRYNRPFWLSYKNPDSGEIWTRKVK